MIILRKQFAKVDYKGLTKAGKEALKFERAQQARFLNEIKGANNNLPKSSRFGKTAEERLKTRNKLHKQALEESKARASKARENIEKEYGTTLGHKVKKAFKDAWNETMTK